MPELDLYQIDSALNPPLTSGTHYSWETPPAQIPESEIAETLESEVVVIGGGIAGLATAARCSQLGLSVTLLEKTKSLVAHGAHIAVLSSKIMRENGVVIDKKQFARDWMKTSGSRVNEDLLWLYINRSEEALDWLLEAGGDNVFGFLCGSYYRGPDFTEYPGTHVVQAMPDGKYKTRGAFMYCEICEDVARANGAAIIRNTTAKYLEKDGARVVAVIAQGEDGKYRRYKGSRGVVLATGDIAGNPEMLEKFSPNGLLPKRNGSFPAGSNLGEGHMMGYWAGGAFESAPWALSLHLVGYAMYSFFFLHVNPDGKRFMNEDTWVQAKSLRVLMQKSDYAYSVFDDKYFEELTRLAQYSGGQFVDPLVSVYGEPWDSEHNDVKHAIDIYIQRGLCHKADTIEELAEKMGVPVENLVKTVERYNELYRKGDDTDYGKRSVLLTSIEKPPYYALKFGPALLTVFGGLNIDTSMRVLDSEQEPIPGLLAVGNVSGGLHGVDYPLLLNGNSIGRAITWALVAAETMTADNS